MHVVVAAILGLVAGVAEPVPEPLKAINQVAPFTLADLGHAMLCMVVAAGLGAILAFRPRPAGGPPRGATVIQTQIMLAIVGSLVMLVVGASLARAFAIAGVAGLVRYRAKIDDPKDASVMLSCLAVGLASGVGLIYLAGAGTVFIMGVLRILEWREPWPTTCFELKVKAKNPAALKPALEGLLKKHRVKFELRGSTENDMTYLVDVPQGKGTDELSEAVAALHGGGAVDVAWVEKKPTP
jgi:hypothetical protein